MMNVAQTNTKANFLYFQANKGIKHKVQPQLSFKGGEDSFGLDKTLKDMETQTKIPIIKMGLESQMGMHIATNKLLLSFNKDLTSGEKKGILQSIPNSADGIASTFENTDIPGFRELGRAIRDVSNKVRQQIETEKI